MPTTVTGSTPHSNYITSNFPSGQEVVFTITVRDDILTEDINLHHITLWDSEYARSHRTAVPNILWSLEKVSNTEYLVRYTSDYSITSVSINFSGHPEITTAYTIATASVGPLPQDIDFKPEDLLVYNGEKTTVVLTKNLRGRALSFNNLSVNVGRLSNFRGSGHNYRVDITPPPEGFGIIKLRVNGFSSGLIEEVLHAPLPTEDVLFVSRHKPIPYLAREDEFVYLQEITDADLDDLNDLIILIVFDQDVTGFTEDDVTLLAIDDNNDVVEATVVGFRGEGSVYEVRIRILSPGGGGKVVVGVPHNATDQGNPEKSLTICYSDEIVKPDWEVMFLTTETYNDIVSVGRDGVQLLRGNQIDHFSFDGEVNSDRQVALPYEPVVTRAIEYDVGKYLGLATARDSKAHLFVEGATEWSSESVFTLATDRATAERSDIQGLAVNDWAWTRDRRMIVASIPFQNHAASIGSLHSLEIHKAIREGTDLNDVVFEGVSVDYGILDIDSWDGLVALAHAEGKLFVGSNDTRAANYIFVFDAEHRMVLGQQIPIEGRVKSLFAKNGWLYRYNDTTKTLMRFPLDALRLPAPKKEIYPQSVLPGDEIDLLALAQYASRVVFDVGFKKPRWLSIEDNTLKIAADTPVKSTAYVRLRAINNNGASLAGSFGFYVYVRELRAPEWKNFDKLSMYHDQVLNMFAYVDGAEEITWQDGFTPPAALRDNVIIGGVDRGLGAVTPVAAIPEMPNNVILSPQDTSLGVSWQIPPVYPALTRQEIRYAESLAGLASASWTDIGSTSARSHTLTSLINGRTYYVQVRLTNSEGVGEPNTPVSGVPNLVAAVPSVATGITVTAENKAVLARWTLPYAYPALSGQQIRWATSTEGLEGATWTDLTDTATSYRITPLVNGEVVYVQLRGVNSEGNGEISAAVSATPLGVPERPTGVSATGDNMVVSVAWTIGAAYPALSKQQIRWATSEAALTSAAWTDVAADATSYDITGLTNGEAVYVQVRGVNSEGNSAVSDTVSATPAGASGPSVVRNIRTGANVDFRGRVWASFQWQAPESLGRSTSGTPSLVRYEYRTTRATGTYQSNDAWRSVGTALTTRQIGFTYSDGAPTIEIRAINNNAPPDNEGEILTVTYQNGAWS